MTAQHPRWEIITGDCRDVLPTIGDVDHVAMDPPYGEHVHRSVRTAGRRDLPDVVAKKCRTRRAVDLGFESLGDELRTAVADWAAQHSLGWTLVFSDVESSHRWVEALTRTGELTYKRTGAWIRRGGAPQFSGTHPAAGFEAVVMCHRKGRSRWNGGGHPAIYDHPVVANRKGQQGTRYHTAQKPIALMRELIRLFTDPGDLVLDPFAGVGTTVLACVLEGRRAIGIERSPEWAAIAHERIESELAGVPYRRHAGNIASMAPRSQDQGVLGLEAP